ncbi:GNAT family N-acetyltransferase, partial [uncultured Ruminobacter sp.]|uniref:GNAT family N-acetyltransferase n=1 Tax=uncultured Ruminobacter sp. TaxID=538947 RepID=UPI0025DBE213
MIYPWDLTNYSDPDRKPDGRTGSEPDDAFTDLLYSCFDKYKDCLPLREEWAQYTAEHRFIRYPAEGQPAGGVVWKKKGSVVTEEYIFTDAAQRKKKIAGYLHEQLCAEAFGNSEKGKLIAWVNETNTASQALHTSCGYTKDAMKKTAGNNWDTNLKGQLDYLISELKSGYSNLYKTLTTTNSVKEAASQMVDKFEVCQGHETA